MSDARGRFRVPAAVLGALLAVGVLSGFSGCQTRAPAGGDAQPTVAPTAEPTEPATGDAENTVTLSGSATGEITDIAVDCTALTTIGAWSLTGTSDGQPVELGFNTNAYQGARTYNATGVSDAEGGLVGLAIGEGAGLLNVASNGNTPGTFTVDDGEQSGSIDAVLQNVGQEVRVIGTWTCD